MPGLPRSPFRSIERSLSQDAFVRELLTNAFPDMAPPVRFSPPAEVQATELGWEVRLEVPGMLRSDLTVDLEGGLLVIRGEKKRTTRPGARVTVCETTAGAFKREFRLSGPVDASAVTASLDAGILTVVLPAAEGGGATSVPVV